MLQKICEEKFPSNNTEERDDISEILYFDEFNKKEITKKKVKELK